MINMKLLITELDNILCNENGALYEDAIGFLRAAHEKFFTIILTNHPLRNTQERVRNFGISEYIDLIVSATEYEMPKPDPRMINVLLALLNTEGKKFDKGDIILVGDRPSLDVKFGNKAGISAIRMRRGKFSAEEPEYSDETAKIEVKNLSELAASIEVEIKPEPVTDKPREDLSRSFDVSEEEEPRKEQDDISRGFPVDREILVPMRKKKPRARKAARKPKRSAKKKAAKKSRFGFFGI